MYYISYWENMFGLKFYQLGEKVYRRSLGTLEAFVTDIDNISIGRESTINRASISKELPLQIKFESPRKKLIKRKKSLLKELQTIDQELTKVHQDNNYANSRIKNQNTQGSEQDFQRASRLVAKMNKQRHEMNERKNKKSKQIQMQVQKSLKKLEEMSKERELRKEEKKKEIQNKIDTRKDKLKSIKQYNRKADQLIGQLNSYRVSLPIIQSEKNIGVVEKKLPPEISSLKRYKKSLFLERLEMQQRRKIQQHTFKQYEKRRLRQKYHEYGRRQTKKQ